MKKIKTILKEYLIETNVCPTGFIITIPITIFLIYLFDIHYFREVNVLWAFIQIPIVYLYMDYKVIYSILKRNCKYNKKCCKHCESLTFYDGYFCEKNKIDASFSSDEIEFLSCKSFINKKNKI